MSVTRKEFQFQEIFILKGNYDLAILSRQDKGTEKTKEKGSLEDINLSLIGGVRVEAFT